MPEIIFVFGPNKSFFFDCPKSWKFHNVPQTLRQLFNSSMSPAWRIAQPYCLALGPQIDTPEPIWYCGCRVVDGQEKIFYSQSYFEINYPDLSQWTRQIPNAPRVCFITFGPGLSYFASAPGHGSIWAGAPPELTNKVQKAFDTPCCVSLGLNQAWFVLWPDGYFAWRFNGNYGDLDDILNKTSPRSVSYLAISPYNKEHYFVAFRDRTVKYNFAGCSQWMPQMQEIFDEWQAELAQKQRFSQPYPSPHAQWDPYFSPPGRPTYVAAHYVNSLPTPPFSPYSPYGDPDPQQVAVELPAAMAMPPAVHPVPAPALAPPPAVIPTPSHKDKRKKFLSRILD